MNATDNMLPQLTKEQRSDESSIQLEAAFIYLLDEFRKAYVADQVQKESRVYEKLSTEFGISDDAGALEVFVQKMYALSPHVVVEAKECAVNVLK